MPPLSTRSNPCTEALPFAADTSDIIDLDEEFAHLIRWGKAVSKRPCLIETSACNFDVMVPTLLQAMPMWVLLLPEELSGDVEHLARLDPIVSELSSVDLLKRRATIEWATKTHRVCVDTFDVLSSLSWALRTDAYVVIAFVTPTRTAVRALRVDKEFVLTAWWRGDSCDAEYLPELEFSAAELQQALVRSVVLSDEHLIEDDGARKLVYLAGKQHLYDQPREC